MESTILKFRELRQSVTNYAIQLNQTQASVKKYAEEFKRSQTQTEQLRQRHEALAASLKNLKGKIPIAEWRQMKEEAKNVKAALKESEANTKAAGRAFEQAKNQAASLRNKLAEQRAELQQIKANMESAGYSAQHLAQSESRLRQEIQQTTRALEQANRVQAQVDASRAAKKNNSQALQDTYNAYGNFQGAIGTAQTIVSPLARAIENAMTFEHAMSRVKALTQSGLIRQGDFDGKIFSANDYWVIVHDVATAHKWIEYPLFISYGSDTCYIVRRWLVTPSSSTMIYEESVFCRGWPLIYWDWDCEIDYSPPRIKEMRLPIGDGYY